MKWVVSLLLLFASHVHANSTTSFSPVCPDAKIFGSKMLDGICYDCILPIRLVGKIKLSDHIEPDDYSDNAMCSCKDGLGVDHPGTTFSLWLPSMVYEVVRTPFCSPTLTGIILGTDEKSIDGLDLLDIVGVRPSKSNEITERTRYHTHMFAFPLMFIMKLFTSNNCLHGGLASFDMLGAPSELLPGWNDEELSIYLSPECLLASNEVAAALCSIDGIAATTLCAPRDELPFCAGFWGLTCPMTGHLNAPINSTMEQSLLIARYLQYHHRLGLFKKTYGDNAMCGTGAYAITTPKQQYRLSMVYPRPEASIDPTGRPGGEVAGSDINRPCTGDCCHYIGEHHWKWGLGRNSPGPGENGVYLGFQYKQCCSKIIGLGL